MKKKVITFLNLILFLAIFVLSGCGKETGFGTENSQNGKGLNIVCALFPEYDWTREIIGDTNGVTLTCLINNGTDPHSYQPTARDIALIEDCDLFIFAGGESEAWMEEVISLGATNPGRRILNMMEVLENRIYEEEIIEGMQTEESKNPFSALATENSAIDEETEYDEHIWLSLKNAVLVCENISQILCELDSGNRDEYIKNKESYISLLTALDTEYEKTISEAREKTLIFADRFPFRYLIEDYKLNYYAAFSGCSADAEASFETIVFLSDLLNDSDAKAIFVLETSDGKLAKAAIETAGRNDVEILVLNSLQSVSKKQINNGISYLGVMKDNLNVISEGLYN